MVCQSCGNPIGPDVRFCAHCGAQVAAAPASQNVAPQNVPPPQQFAAYPPYPAMMVIPRVQRHLQTLGTLWCVYAAYRVVQGLLRMFFFRMFAERRWGGDWPLRHHMGWGWGGAPWMHMMPVIAGFTVIAALLAVFVGYSLLTRRTWGRVLAIVVGVLVLFKPVLGTALGIYTLWVLAPAASGLEYDAIAEPG